MIRGINSSDISVVDTVQHPAINRSNSTAVKFSDTLSSILTYGVLSESDKIRLGVSYTASNDGTHSKEARRNKVDVTRIQYNSDPEERKKLATEALTMPFNGALSVVIERKDSDIPFIEKRIGISKEQEAMIKEAPEEIQDDLRKALENQTLKEATNEGLEIASSRMENSFLLIMKPFEQPKHLAPREADRQSIRPEEILEVVVPEAHADSIQELNDRMPQSRKPEFHYVGLTKDLVPNYQLKNGEKMKLDGVSAPNYRDILSQMINKYNGVDIHIVRAGS